MAGNFIGTNAAGTGSVPNVLYGAVYIDTGRDQQSDRGTNPIERNVISGTLKKGSSSMATGRLELGRRKPSAPRLRGGLLGNALSGVKVFNGASGNIIGGTTAAARNIISGNTSDGVLIAGSGSSGNIVEGNYIGTDASGMRHWATPGRVSMLGGAANTTIGTVGGGNVILGNALDGVFVADATTTGAVIQGNPIGTNAAGTSAIANSQRGIEVQNAPR